MHDVYNTVSNSPRSTTHDYVVVHADLNTGKQSSYPGVSTPYFPASRAEVVKSACPA